MIQSVYGIKIRVLRAADKLESDAGYSGSSNDGGASRLRENLDLFLQDLRIGAGGNIPSDNKMIEVPRQFLKYMED